MYNMLELIKHLHQLTLGKYMLKHYVCEVTGVFNKLLIFYSAFSDKKVHFSTKLTKSVSPSLHKQICINLYETLHDCEKHKCECL